MGNDDDKDIVELLERKITAAERQLARLKAALATFRDTSPDGNRAALAPNQPLSGVVPPIVDICTYLAQTGKPAPQNELIRAVGDLRQKRYPLLSNHYSNVWRALEYHVRHDRMIACVDQQGRAATLKPLPRRPKGKKLYNSPELYEQDNWFMLKEQIEEDYAPRSLGAQRLFERD